LPISILNDSAHARTESYYARFDSEHVLERVRRLDERARKEGLAAISPSDDPLVNIGMEVNSAGEVTKNSYGVLDLAWQAAERADWPERVMSEVNEIRARIREAHGVNIRFLIWAGMGGSIEDKTAYNAIGLLKGGPMFYSLDSTDPAKLKSILADMETRAKEPIAKLLPATLVAGMAMGMTSYEPVVNLERLAALYDKYRIDSTANFIYMTLPGSILDQFAGPRGYRRIPLQLDEGNSTAGRHSAPLTRGSLYPLALAGCDLKKWIGGAILSDGDISEALKLSAFLQAQAEQGRDKVTLLLPKSWTGVGLWTKQDFEESLGKSEQIGIKIVIGESPNFRNYRKVEDPAQDRVFLAIQRKGEAHPDAEAITRLRSAHYPIAILTIPAGAPLSHYMQLMHYAVFGLGLLRDMNFVTQPAVELYKSIAGEIAAEAKQVGGVAETAAWKALGAGRRWRGAVSVETPQSLATAIQDAAKSRRIEYGELTFFGDMRYSEGGRQMRKALETAGQRLFRSKLKMPVDIYEGPAMNHSYHEMVIGHGRCFSIVLLSEKQGQQADYHMAQFLATKLALERKGRLVRAILVKDLSGESIGALGEFFSETARLI
jgi:glucose-6-phosphate isomerase